MIRMGSNTSNHGFYKPSEGETGWSDEKNSDWDKLEERVPWEIAGGTVTASGGSSPAASTTITGVSSNQLVAFDVVVSVDADPSFDADYGFNYDYEQHWDDSEDEVDVVLTVNWDDDPGNGNDVTLRYSIQERVI